MGQYQQWLHYQEVDRRLRAELEALETELTHLQDSMHDHPLTGESSSNGEVSTGQTALQTKNIIIHALVSSLNAYTSTPGEALQQAANLPPHLPPGNFNATNGSNEQEFAGSNSPLISNGGAMQPTRGETISPALMNWSELPNFGPQELEGASPVMEQPAVPATPHPEIVLLPEDMSAFFDEHAQTQPQLALPWWMRDKATSAPAHGRAGSLASIDLELMRMNQMVRRWMERREQLSHQTSDPPLHGKPEEVAHDE